MSQPPNTEEDFPPKPKVAFVDADFLVYSVGFSSKDAEEQMAKNRLTEWFTDIVYIALKCEDYKAFITGKTNFRYGVATTVPYKGNRKDSVKPPHYDALRKHLERMEAVVTENEEADDAVGIESTRYVGWIVHVDKDLDQLPGWHYNPVKNEEYFVTEQEGLYNFYLQLLTGDRVDNIQGLKGIGPVKAKKILANADLSESYELGLLKAVQEAYKAAGEAPERVLENGQLLWLRREPEQMWQLPIKE